MESNSTSDKDEKVPGASAVDIDSGQNNLMSNTTYLKKENAEILDHKSLHSFTLSDLLDEFVNKDNISESAIDQALVLLRLSPTTLVDVDESAVVAFLLTAVEKSDERVASKYLLLLSSLLSFTVSSRSLRLIVHYLMASNKIWMLVIPPISKFPYQNGWTFQTWIYIDPSLCNLREVKPRYLFSFQTDKGLGYTAHFLGTLFIVTSIRAKDKGLQHCVPAEFHPCRWYMLTIVFVYNRWTKSELRCYVDGKITSSVEMAWPIAGSDPFERCVIGGSFDQRDENLFSGRIASIIGFTEALSPQQISALYTLGPNYKAGSTEI
ncbi:unnamed protein product [Hydatigera taeniaeformis]|uniref:Neurobeachin n=1 Tax=Hydatigena taeniaeformis TaxID=6205 RepID=A0A0R3WKL7_HYDTA|nr:unnamed protein product [Hydatigera taeniaeformis]